MTPHGDRHPSMLKCSAYKYYPKQIRVTWLRNGQEVPSNMTSSEELANGDWHYQIHSYPEYTPTPGENIYCMVEYASFTEPKILHWDMSLPESERSKIAIGASGLVLGLVSAAAGLLYYNRRKIAIGASGLVLGLVSAAAGLLYYNRRKITIGASGLVLGVVSAAAGLLYYNRRKITIGASGLVLGVVSAAAGLLYYNRRKTTGGDGMELVPTSHTSQ
ncbi:rano class II histocompatibility antigen, A beta chain-like [Oncorhynchus keta]|uniref:rano class II histocompatibility antigen, A beta chain-like n=1 Tax=Oncorhynchus keta TaxID=8018 RepID=UPI00227CE9BB|nr:rano class II histocompatibility antigen, A beta chain-like [Oncorhynchus keta]XP_052384022.1 rano class II histocompatibility antigen, A beta chain-like [Oncorhynchus keta]